MAGVPNKVQARLIAGMKKFQPVMASAKTRDVNESDTSVIVSDVFCALFGYDKYTDLTTEHCIRNTYCDLALKVDGKVRLLVELKAIGLSLKDIHLKQAVDYAANHGVDWIVLSNGEQWQIHKIIFEKPIKSFLVDEFNFLTLDPKNEDDISRLYLICKEAWSKSVLDKYLEEKEVLNKFTIGGILLSEDVVALVRRTLRKMWPGVKICDDDVLRIIESDVIKREVLGDEKTAKTQRKIQRLANKAEKMKEDNEAVRGAAQQ